MLDWERSAAMEAIRCVVSVHGCGCRRSGTDACNNGWGLPRRGVYVSWRSARDANDCTRVGMEDTSWVSCVPAPSSSQCVLCHARQDRTPCAIVATHTASTFVRRPLLGTCRNPTARLANARCVWCVCVCVCCLIVNFSKGRPHNERLRASGTRSFPCGRRKSACGG